MADGIKKWLLRRFINETLLAHGGFRYPAEIGAVVEAPDWNPLPWCGGGLHGLLNGIGYFDLPSDGVWMVLEVLGDEVVEFEGKAKIRRGRVAYIGDLRGAIRFLNEQGIYETIFAVQKGGSCAFQVAGYGSRQDAGRESVQVAGNSSSQEAGIRVTQVAGHWSSQTADYESVQVAGQESTQDAEGEGVIQVAGRRAVQHAGSEAVQIADWDSVQGSGERSIQVGRPGSVQTAGKRSIHVCRYSALEDEVEFTVQPAPESVIVVQPPDRWNGGRIITMTAEEFVSIFLKALMDICADFSPDK